MPNTVLQQGRIDVHHHIVPPFFRDAMLKKGIDKVAGAPLPSWSPSQSIEIMDQIGTETAIVSLSAPGVYFGNVKEACDLARQCNEYSVEMRENFPKRFGFFAVLPMPLTHEACTEAIYSLDVLKADGIVLLGSTNGIFLGDSRFEELMFELNKRKAIVFIHPNLHQSSENLGLSTPGFILEFLPDTTRAAVNLITSGVMERFPDIQFILAHAGGFLPYVSWRVSLGNLMSEMNKNAPQGMMTYIQRFYFDTALSPSPYAMSSLKELVGTERILFGSDFPFAPAPVSHMQVQSLDQLNIFNQADQYKIQRANALSLFPQYQKINEQANPRPIYQQESLANKFKRWMAQPIIAIAEKKRSK
ncbi:amidohydrolase family protein [Acinetobacter sp.]|jgi:predicted TIM-barrel fold metal-dependent hydrolase|uniref:amidohydrolase family protein n=1 Tax=Acinetobacter sp. TaxID=472 RepID=UPI0028320DC4|nr:amidohydrolase family protein [Acinetobacter sp.]MDR0235725.1 amidohydrolase [Acinetobacter sp.]